MRGFLIDPGKQTVEEIDADGSYDERRVLLGITTAGCVYPTKMKGLRTILWLDDNGFYAEPPLPLFTINGYAQPLAGKALLLGLDDGEGDHKDCPFNLAQVEHNITWRPDLEFTGMIEQVDEEYEHPALGKMTKLTVTATFRTKKGDESDGR